MQKIQKNQEKSLTFKEKINKFKENHQLRIDIFKLTNQWKEIMAQTNTYNQEYLTFTLSHIQKENYGYKCRIYAPYGLSFDELEKLKPIIEDNLSCIFLYNKKKMHNFVTTTIVLEGFGGNDIIYTPPKISPYEVYLGKAIDSNDVVISSKEVSHFLLSGSNGSGKSRMLDCMLTTLIYNCNEQQIELYLVQISKNDLIIYEDAIQCRAFCENLDQAEIMLNHIIEKMKERDNLIKPMRKDFKGSNITDYNKLHPQNKLSICWIIFDEMASLMNKSGNTEVVKKQKDRIIAMVEEIARVGRALGIFLGCCLQRPKADSLSPDVKAQANLRISFAQNNEKSSEIAMDDGKVAVGLDERVAVYSCRATGYDFVKTPYIDDDIIAQYVKPKCKRGHRTLFDDLKKLEKNNIDTNIKTPQSPSNTTSNQPQEKTIPKDKGTAPLPQKIKQNLKPQTKVTIAPSFDNVDPNIINQKQEQIKTNISKIPDFVPYIPEGKIKTIKIIDQTKIGLNPSQKPIKKEDE